MEYGKKINARIVQKHDTLENWETKKDFIPEDGEIIIYDYPDTRRVKIGDGKTPVGTLPYLGEGTYGRTYYATPADNLNEIINNAEPGSTIVLAAGSYGTLNLTLYSACVEKPGSTRYDYDLTDGDRPPENLTITGAEGATVYLAGINMTSGINQAYYFARKDVSKSMFSKGLSFNNIHFTEDFTLTNCGIEGLSITNCEFPDQVNISITPNQIAPNSMRYAQASVRVKDLVISNNTFRWPNQKYVAFSDSECVSQDANNYSKKSAILALSVDGAKICNNEFITIAWNAIQIATSGSVSSTNASGYAHASNGHIIVEDNKISTTGSRAIRVNALTRAELLISRNIITNSNRYEIPDGYKLLDGTLAKDYNEKKNNITSLKGTEVIKISNCTPDCEILTTFNYYGTEGSSFGSDHITITRLSAAPENIPNYLNQYAQGVSYYGTISPEVFEANNKITNGRAALPEGTLYIQYEE